MVNIRAKRLDSVSGESDLTGPSLQSKTFNQEEKFGQVGRQLVRPRQHEAVRGNELQTGGRTRTRRQVWWSRQQKLPTGPAGMRREARKTSQASVWLRYQLVLLLQCTLDKQKKPWHPAKINIMTEWVTREAAWSGRAARFYCKGLLPAQLRQRMEIKRLPGLCAVSGTPTHQNNPNVTQEWTKLNFNKSQKTNHQFRSF